MTSAEARLGNIKLLKYSFALTWPKNGSTGLGVYLLSWISSQLF